jgi:hypothetical protein
VANVINSLKGEMPVMESRSKISGDKRRNSSQDQRLPEDRYYLHGDLLEGSTTLHYCSVLDVFMTPDHFEEEREKGCCGQTQEYWIRRSVKSYKYHRKTGGRRIRPHDADNPWKTRLDVIDRLIGKPRRVRRS